MQARAAWVVVWLAVVAAALDTIFTAAHRSLMSEATWADHGWPLAPLAAVGCALMGALIVSRVPRHPIGWLLCTASLLAVTLAADAYSSWALDGAGPGDQRWGHLAAWAGSLLGWPAFTALILVFLIAPDGHLATTRWRWVVWVAGAGLLLRTMGALTSPPEDFVTSQQGSSSGISAPLLTSGSVLIATALIAAATSVVVRLRRSQDDERRQLLWIASSAAFLAVGVVVVLVVPLITGAEGSWLAGLPLRLALVAVPLCVAVAVLRHRLLDIDLIVNRAVLLALATALVAAGYVLVVVTVGFVVDESTSGFWPSLFATAVVALTFQPVRHRVVRLADRLSFGPAAAPYEALADFSRRIGDSPDPTTLLPATAEAAARAVDARRTRVVLRVDAGDDLYAVWPPAEADDLIISGHEVPVLDHGEGLGRIMVERPAGRPLRQQDHDLLVGLAEQAGLAFRNTRLTAELAAQVDQLGQQTRELSESRGRLITAGDAERRRLERAISRQVIPHLADLPRLIHELSTTLVDSGERVGPVIDSVGAAVEALRDITRGVYPAQLGRSGLPAAVGSLLARANDARLVVEDSAAGRRFDQEVEAAAYFCVVEAARGLAGPVLVVLRTHDAMLRVEITGRDHGDLALRHVRDRVEAAGGSISATTFDGELVLTAMLPALAAR